VLSLSTTYPPQSRDGTAQGEKPKAASARWPYAEHRTMAQVMAEEGYHSPFRKISDAPSDLDQFVAGWRRVS
jgi:hypothetical protein